MSEPNVHLVLNSRDSVDNTTRNRPAPYQSTLYATKGQNLLQGQIEKLSVNEVNFPYDIPNVLTGYNYFDLLAGYLVSKYDVRITITPGFYTGLELATKISAEIASVLTADGVNPLNFPTCTYDDASNLFTFEAPVAPTAPGFAELKLISPAVYPNLLLQVLSRDLLSIMGFQTYQGYLDAGKFTTGHPLVSSSAPLTFTQYIDICSPELCQFQELKTGNTTNLSRRTDIICRLYVSNNISVNDAGYRPFIINRQYTNERMMRWTADNSIGNMSIQLYDDLGEPLKYEWRPRDFQITFNVYERERSIGSGSVIRP